MLRLEWSGVDSWSGIPRKAGELTLTVQAMTRSEAKPSAADKKHPEVDTGRDRWPALGGQARGVKFFDPGIETILFKEFV
jgi:hypothetical protein